MNPLVSVILPTYNVEKYIDQCLESICSQSYNEIEIIVVIDGATDNSFEIAKKWTLKDQRIKVIYQENAGSGPARNNGIANCHGEFMMFVDPDDWINANMIEDYIAIQKKYNADFVASGYYEEYFESGKVLTTPKPFSEQYLKTQDDVRDAYIKLFLIEAVSAPTRILYRSSIIRENDILFPDLRRSQDIVFNYRYYSFIKKLYLSNNLYYHYRINSESYLLKIKDDYYKTIQLMYDEIVDMYKAWEKEIDKDDWYGLNNKFLVIIGYYIEACIMRKSSFQKIIKMETFKNISINSKPKESYHRCLKWFIVHRFIFGIKLLVGFKIFVKKNCKSIFKHINKIKKF